MPTTASASALTNWYAQPGALERRVYTDLLDKEMDAVEITADRVKIQLDDLYTTRGDKKDSTIKIADVSSIADLPVKSEDIDDLPVSHVAPGWDITLTPVNYRQSLKVTEDMQEMDRFGRVMQMMAGLMKGGLRQKQYALADLFNNAFATYTGGDGMYLLDTGHPYRDPSAGTWDNLDTGALTHGRLSTARVNFRKSTNDKGHRDPIKLMRLLVPPDLEQKAIEIRKAEKMPENALNQPNWLQNTFDIQVCDWFTGTNDWFCWGDHTEPAEAGLYYGERYPLSVRPLPAGELTAGIIWGRYLKVAFDYSFNVVKNLRGSTG